MYLPKLESHREARLWNRVFERARDELGLPRGTIRATVLIETILAAFEMDEILYELGPHATGLNAGRWDYLFSFIKKPGHRPEFVLPDRNSVGTSWRTWRRRRSPVRRCGNGSSTARSAPDDVRRITDEEVAKLGEGYDEARGIFEQIAVGDEFVELLTLPAYEHLS